MRFSVKNKQIEGKKCEDQEIEKDELQSSEKLHVCLFDVRSILLRYR